MKKYFTVSRGELVHVEHGNEKLCICTLENDTEKEELIRDLKVDPFDLDAALDSDEISRIEFSTHVTSIIWKRPYRLSENAFDFGVASTGLFLHNDLLTIIISKENVGIFLKEEFHKVNSTTDILLKYFFYTVRKYLQHLKDMKKATKKLESEINSSYENKAFLQMFDLSESLVYYLNAIEANGSVLTKLRQYIGKRHGTEFTDRQIEFLDNIILENEQCARQAQIYSTVLSGLMDARGNVINNNMNVLLKNLTLINVIFLPLNLIVGMGGMSEFTMLMEHYRVNWQFGYAIFTVIMFLVSWLSWYVLKRFINKTGKKERHNIM